MLCIQLTLQENAKSKEKIEGVPKQTFTFEKDQKINYCKNQYPVLKVYVSIRERQPRVSYFSYDSVRERQPGVSYFSYNFVREHQHRVSYFPMISFENVNSKFRIFTIPFRSINSESRIFLRFRSGVLTRSLVFSYDSIWEHRPGVSYFTTILFGSVNPESRIFLRFRSGASTQSLVFFYDSVRERPLGVSYFPMISFKSVN